MFKRPLAAAAVCALLCALCVVRFFPEVIFPPSALRSGDEVSVSGKIYKIEEKTHSIHVYIRAGGKRLLLTTAAGLFSPENLKPGFEICARCVFEEFKSARNRGNFDEGDYYRSLGIYQKYKIKYVEITGGRVRPVSQGLRLLKSRMKTAILACTEDDSKEAGVLIAMACADKSALNDEIRDLYSAGGIAHILAVSGLHVSFVGMGIYRILRRFAGYKVSAGCAVALIICYCIMSGGAASAFRAATMLIVRLAAEGLGKKYDLLSALSLSAILLLVENPFYVNNTGFLLSFGAVAGIGVLAKEAVLFLMPGKEPKYEAADQGRSKSAIAAFAEKAAAKAAEAALVCVSIFLTTLPVIISAYYEYPLYGAVLNLPVVRLMGICLGSALTGAFVGNFSLFLGRLCLGSGVYVLRLVEILCDLSLSLPGAKVVTGAPRQWQIIVYYAVLGCALIAACIIRKSGKQRPARQARLGFALFAALSALLIISCRPQAMSLRDADFHSGQEALQDADPHSGATRAEDADLHSNAAALRQADLLISFLDVDQGECIFIKSPEGATFLIDAGSATVGDIYDRRIGSALKYMGAGAIDYLIITHPDRDHISGVLQMLDEDYKIGRIITPHFPENGSYEEISLLAAGKNIPVSSVYEGMQLSAGGIELTFLAPARGHGGGGENELSAVICLQYGEFSALFTGDISSRQETELLDSPYLPGEIDVLDVAHHGSKNSSCAQFLSAVSPKWAVISAGADNMYGHPHADTLARLTEAGANVLCTATAGQINIYADKSGFFAMDALLQ
ncbi:MAG: ComEC/Rec2 family competence protein [Lachnospiraceae bacterium]|jgi:competence protein ComEC